MTPLAPGANAPLPSGDLVVLVRHGAIPGAEIDVSAFLVGASGKVRSDADMCFYGQPQVAAGAVALSSAAQGETRFAVSLSRIPADVEKVVVTATIHDNRATFSRLAQVDVEAGGVAGRIPCAGKSETALILAEIYRRGGDWKLRIVGQGFAGGLAPLARHLGVEIAEEAPAASAAPPPAAAAPALRLEKRLVDLGKRDPELLSLVKKVQVSLEKRTLATDRAKVALCLDISGSMAELYASGAMDVLVRRVMALGYRFDDDGEIDVFLFGRRAHAWGAVGVADYRSFVSRLRARVPLEDSTRYGEAMSRIRAHYAAENPEGLPVYVMFVTDGAASDKGRAEVELRAASAEPIFWQFMAIEGRGSGWARPRFDFLESLDALRGRVVDNAGFFKLADPADPTDEAMFDLLMTEYPQWLRAAVAAGVLRLPA